MKQTNMKMKIITIIHSRKITDENINPGIVQRICPEFDVSRKNRFFLIYWRTFYLRFLSYSKP